LQAALVTVRFELHDAAGGNRRQPARIHTLEQLLGQLGKPRLQLHLYARRQEGDAFEQTLDIGIGTFVRLDAQPTRDARMDGGEFRSQLAQEGQLLVVEVGEAALHHEPPISATAICRESTSTMVRSSMCCGRGLPHSSASMRNDRPRASAWSLS